MARPSRRTQNRLDGIRGALLGFLGVLLIAGLAGGAWWIARTRIPTDAETNCPRSAPAAIHVLIFDQSDPITGQQAQRVRQAIQRLKESAAEATRFDIYTFDGDEKSELRPTLAICVPKRPENANEWTENRRRIERKYNERFASVLDATVDRMLKASSRPTSPILESLRAAALTSFGPSDGITLRMTLVSDLVQHSPLLSHFRSPADADALLHSQEWPRLRPNFKGARIEVFYLLRPTAVRANQPIQTKGHQMYWGRLIEAAGGVLDRIEPN